MSEQNDQLTTNGLENLVGKYLTFNLGAEIYGLEILKVQEIIGLMTVTSVPRTPEYVRGVVNLRGKVIPVVELRVKFNMTQVEDTERTCIIVVQVAGENGDITMGIIVDEVSEVIDITFDQLESAPNFDSSVNTEYILAMGKLEHKVVILLDADKVLSQTELTNVTKTSASQE